MRHHLRYRAYPRTLVLAAGLLLIAACGARAEEPAPVKIGFVTFLTGPAAAAFGIPDHNAAELLVEALNSGRSTPPTTSRNLSSA